MLGLTLAQMANRTDVSLGYLSQIELGIAGTFWPARPGDPSSGARYRIRRLGALALLLALYVTGVLDSSGGSATLEGLLLLGLIAGWLWMPGLRARRMLAAVAWLAVAGAVAAVVSGSLAGGQAWLHYRAWNLLGAGTQSTAFSWDQTYGPIPWARSQSVMFTVRSRSPQLWKVTTLDRFDGVRFVRSGTEPASEADLPLPLNDRWYEFARFTIEGLRSRLLPIEQGTTAGVTLDRPIDYQTDGTVRTPSPAPGHGASYTVMSYVPQPSPAELRKAPRTFPAAYLHYTDFDLPAPSQSGLHVATTDPLRRGLFFTSRTVGTRAPRPSPAAGVGRRILASPYGPMYRLARRLASGKRSPYDVAVAIESYLKANYTYSERTPMRRFPLESFLFGDLIGYCQQFSGAMALLLRMDGIPARVAAGFLPGSYDAASRSYRVRAIDAHSWVEVYFAGIGWVPFDPTPPRSVGRAPRGPVFTEKLSQFDAIAATVGAVPRFAGQRIPTVHPRRSTRTSSAGGVVLLAAALVAALTLLSVVARWLAGRVRLRRSLDGDGELATIELARALRQLGYKVPATVTLAQIERLVHLHGGADAARYVRLLRERRYGNGNAGVVTLRERRQLRFGLTAHLGLDARLRGQLVLPPGTVAWRLPSPAYSDRPGGP